VLSVNVPGKLASGAVIFCRPALIRGAELGLRSKAVEPAPLAPVAPGNPQKDTYKGLADLLIHSTRFIES
jgi:hypothetical protein